eukprot:Gb_12272 [translate_table: standard]
MDSNEVQQQKKTDGNHARVSMGLSEKKNSIPKKPRIREITSRFMSATISSSSSAAAVVPTSSVTKCPSPRIVTSPEYQSKKPHSAQRRHPSPFPNTVSDSRVPTSEGIMVPKRTLGPNSEALHSSTVSMQAEQFNNDHPLRPTANTVLRSGDSPICFQGKEALEKKGNTVLPSYRESGDQSENARPNENLQSKPSSGKLPGNPMSRSVNNMTERPIRAATSLGQGRARTPRPNSASKSFSGSISDGAVTPNASRMVSLDGRVKGTTLKGTEKNALQVSESGKTNAISEATNQDKQPLSQQELLTCSTATGLDHLASSAESLSSDCTSETQDATRRSVCTSQGSIVPARFWQETNSRCKGISEIRSSMPEAELSSATSGRLRSAGHSGAGRVSKSSTSPWAVSGSQSQASPLSAPQPSISPVKVIPSSSPPSRCLPSPTRSRGQPLPPHPANSLNIRSSSTGSVLNFSGDARKGKKGPSQLEDAHLLRLLHNRQLQWRFINARAEAAMNAQTVTAEVCF